MQAPKKARIKMSTSRGDQLDPWPSPLPPEVWSVVGEQIASARTLRALIRTCRAFREIFSPFLYKYIYFEPLNLSPAGMFAMSRSPPSGFRHTKRLDISIAEYNSSWFSHNPYSIGDNDAYSASITRLLEKMTSLNSLHWLVPCWDGDGGPPLILKNAQLLKALKESQTLKHISIQIACYWLPTRNSLATYTIPFKDFRNLTSIEVYQFDGAQPRLIEDLVDTLGDCPRLQTLGLGFAHDFNSQQQPEAISVHNEDLDFLKRLCFAYGSRRSALPLPLKTLKLGHGLFLLRLNKRNNTPIDNFLSRLVNLSDLRTLHIFNGMFMIDFQSEMKHIELEWSFFEKCTSLHQLSVTRLRSDVTHWLKTVGKSVQELIVTHSYGTFDTELENFNALRLPHLSMLFTREDHGLQVPLGRDPTPLSSSENRWSTRTVLDRLYDGGSKITRLCLDIDLKTTGMRFLTQLRVGPRTWRRYSGRIRESPTETPAIRWEGLDEPKELAYRYAELIKRICPSLQYIRIHDWSWEYLPHRSLVSRPLSWTLRELEYEEILALDILSLERFSDQAAGLPCQERKYRYKPMFDFDESGSNTPASAGSWGSSVGEDT